MNYTFIALGTGIAYIACYYIKERWRWVCILPAIPALIQMLSLFKMPRSPRWVYLNSSVVDIKEEMKWFYSSEASLELQTEYESIKQEVIAVAPNFSIREKCSFLFKEFRRGTLVALGLFIFHQFSSYNVAIYYAPQILKRSGFDLKDDTKQTKLFLVLWAIPFAFVNFLTSLITIGTVDKCGRRLLLLITIPFSSSAMFVLSISMSMIDFYHSQSSAPHWVCLISLLIFCAFFSPGLGSVAWIIGAQIFPLKVRGTGLGLLNFVNFLARFLFTVLFHFTHYTNSGLTVFLIFVCIFGGASWVFSYFCIKETKGLFLQEIQKYYNKSKNQYSRSILDSDFTQTQNNEETKDIVEELPLPETKTNRDSRWFESQLHARRTYTITEESYYTDSVLSDK